MDAIKNLPTPLKIALPIGLVILLVAGIMLSTRGDGTTIIQRTKDANRAEAWVWRLQQDKITNVTTSTLNDGTIEIRVPQASADSARVAIGGNDLKSRLGAKTTSSCTAPGSFSTMNQQKLYDNCVKEAKIEHFMLRPGVLAAKANVNVESSSEELLKDYESSVTVLLYTDPDRTTNFDARNIASQLAAMVPGGDVKRVNITTYDGDDLWVGAQASTDAAGSGADACGTPDGTVDINTREDQVARCKESLIMRQIAPIVGGADRVTTSVQVRLNPSQVSTNSRTATESSVKNTTNGSNDDATTSQTTQKEPTVTETQKETIAGSISRMTVSVTVDKAAATPEKIAAIKSILNGFIDPARDVAPSVKIVAFGTTTSSPNPVTSDAPAPQPATRTPSTVPAGQPTSGIPVAVWAVGMMLLIALGVMVALLMRRNSKDAADRARIERELQNGQRMFQTFAADNPDHIADDIMSLLGAPPANRVPANN